MLVSVVGVGIHWLNVTMHSLYVQWVKFFKICFFRVLCFTCTVHTRSISYTLHITLSHVHLNKHTQRALYSSVNCFPLAFYLLYFSPKPQTHGQNFPDLACDCFQLCIILAGHVNCVHHSLYGTPCISGK